jgi:hypothetical protein
MMVLPLADHGALEALPFLVPALLLTLVIVGALVRDRLRSR